MTRAVIVFLLLTVTLWGCLARGRQLQNIEQLLKDLTHSVGALSNSCGETALWNLLIFLGIVLVQAAFRLVLLSFWYRQLSDWSCFLAVGYRGCRKLNVSPLMTQSYQQSPLLGLA